MRAYSVPPVWCVINGSFAAVGHWPSLGRRIRREVHGICQRHRCGSRAICARLWCVKRDEHVGPGLGGGRPATGHRCVLCAPVSAPCAPGRIRGYPARFPLHGSSGTSNRHFLEAQVQKLAAAVFARLPVEAAGDRSRASTAVPLCIPHMLLRGYGEPQN